MIVKSIFPGSEEWTAVLRWCEQNTVTTMLVTGDMTEPLSPLTQHEAAFERGRVLGAAALFSGFLIPVISIASTDQKVANSLFRRFGISHAILAVESGQPLPRWCNQLDWTTDPWLVAKCVRDLEAEAHAIPISDPLELGGFYKQVGATYWCPEMLEFGHSYVLRDEQLSIVSAGSVQFVINNNEMSYAHIGAVATATSARDRSFATIILRAIRGSLARSGVRCCGVFADADKNWLPGFYERRGFKRLGAFRFANVRGTP